VGSIPIARSKVFKIQMKLLFASFTAFFCLSVLASGKPLDAHTLEDIRKHRAMAAAHEAAARCLESGRGEKTCQQELQTACKGLAIGKYCGMRHSH
jgi:hypothetical protein